MHACLLDDQDGPNRPEGSIIELPHLEHVEDNDDGNVDCLELVASVSHPESQPCAQHSCSHGYPSNGGAHNVSQEEARFEDLGLQADSGSRVVLEHLQPVGIGLVAVWGIRGEDALCVAAPPAQALWKD